MPTAAQSSNGLWMDGSNKQEATQMQTAALEEATNYLLDRLEATNDPAIEFKLAILMVLIADRLTDITIGEVLQQLDTFEDLCTL